MALSFDGAVTGPTARYVSRYPAGDPEIALVGTRQPALRAAHIRPGRPTDAVPVCRSGRGMVYLTGGTGVDLPDVGTGDRISATNLMGVLAYQFGRYVLLVDDPTAIRVEDAPNILDAEPLSVQAVRGLHHELENLFDAVDDGDGDLGDWTPADQTEFEAQLNRRAVTIARICAAARSSACRRSRARMRWEALAGRSARTSATTLRERRVRDITVACSTMRAGRRCATASRRRRARPPTTRWTTRSRAAAPWPNPVKRGSYPLFDRPPTWLT